MENRRYDLMLDLETLGRDSRAIITQIGAVYFDRFTGETGPQLLLNIDPDDSYRHGFTVTPATILWWMQQGDDARNSVYGADIKRIKVLDALNELNAFWKDARRVWQHSTFDAPKIIDHMAVFGIQPTVHYRDYGDLRTICDASGVSSRNFGKDRQGVHHNALDDCLYQIEYTVEALRRIRVQRGLEKPQQDVLAKAWLEYCESDRLTAVSTVDGNLRYGWPDEYDIIQPFDGGIYVYQGSYEHDNPIGKLYFPNEVGIATERALQAIQLCRTAFATFCIEKALQAGVPQAEQAQLFSIAKEALDRSRLAEYREALA